MTEETIKHFEQKNFSAIEDLWMEWLEKNQISLKDFFEVADKLKQLKETGRGLMLLEILANHLENQGRIKEAIAVYKHMPYFTDDDKQIRTALINLYKKQYSDNNRIEKYINLSGIEKGEHIFKSIDRLEEFLKFDIDRVFYFERYGLGRVVSMNPEKKELIIDFEKQKSYVLRFDVARGLLTPIDEEHFLYRKYKVIEDLKKLMSEDPTGLIKYLLKSFKTPLSPGQIKIYLSGIVEDAEMNRFWERVRKKLEKDECIKVETINGQKKYQFIENFDKNVFFLESFEKADIDTKYDLAERCIKDHPELSNHMLSSLISIGREIFSKNPARALDILYLCQDYGRERPTYGIDEIIQNASYEQIISGLKNNEHKRKFLQVIREREPQNWHKIFENIMLNIDDTRLFAEIEEQFSKAGFDLNDFYKNIFLMPQRSPALFHWLLRKVGQGIFSEFLKPTYLPRLINSLNYIKDIKQTFLKVITLEKFDQLIKEAKESESSQIRDAFANCTTLKEFERNNYLKIIDYHFPEMQSQKEDFVYTTPEALKRKKQELEHLLTVEIPKNKAEISRAREYGDLSENFEYKAARERQDQLYQRVRTIESELQKVKIIDFKNLDFSKVCIGAKVSLKNLEDNKVVTYAILGRWDTDLSRNIISNESPVARNLLEKKIGDRIVIDEKTFEISNIEPIDN